MSELINGITQIELLRRTDEPVGVLAVEGVAVVQVQGDGQGLLRGSRPLQDLLGPVHPQEPVHLALGHHLVLLKPQRQERSSRQCPQNTMRYNLWKR